MDGGAGIKLPSAHTYTFFGYTICFYVPAALAHKLMQYLLLQLKLLVAYGKWWLVGLSVD